MTRNTAVVGSIFFRLEQKKKKKKASNLRTDREKEESRQTERAGTPSHHEL